MSTRYDILKDIAKQLGKVLGKDIRIITEDWNGEEIDIKAHTNFGVFRLTNSEREDWTDGCELCEDYDITDDAGDTSCRTVKAKMPSTFCDMCDKLACLDMIKADIDTHHEKISRLRDTIEDMHDCVEDELTQILKSHA